jgi:integrase
VRHTKPPEGMSQTGLFKRGGLYYFRLRTPHDLISYYAKKEFKFSLGCKERNEAIRKVRAELARLELEFADIRQRNARAIRLNDLTQRRVSSLDDDTIDAIAATWLEQNLAADDSLRRMGDIGDDRADIELTVQALRPAYALGQTRIIEPAMDQFVALLGIHLNISPNERQRLAMKFLEATLQAASIREKRLNGEVIQTATIVPATTQTIVPPRSTTSMVTLSDVRKRWGKAVERRPRTLDEVTSLVTAFEAYSQKKPIKSITRQDGIGFRDHLKETRNLSAATLEKNLGLLNALLNFAVDEGLLGANPFSRIKIPKSKTEPITRTPYSEQDLNAIFTCPLFKNGDRPKGGCKEAAVWLPLIAAFTGARLEEIALLAPSDLIHDKKYGWYFSIHDMGEEKHVKTTSSRRKVPAHPVLINAGLIGYRDSIGKGTWLFPDMVPARNGQRSGNWSKWWGRYARQVIGLSKFTVFHSFRHTFKTACRSASIEEAVHDSLTGHASPSVGRGYGEQPMNVLRKAIDRIKYPTVVLPARIWPPT